MAKLYPFEGEMLSARAIAGRIDLAPSTLYKYLKKGYSLQESIDLGKAQSVKIFSSKPKTNNVQANTYPYKDYGDLTVEQICALEKISKEPLYRKLKKGLTPEEAVDIIKGNIAKKYPYLGSFYSKWQLSRFTGVSKWYLDKSLLDNKEYTEEEVTSIIDEYKSQDVCMYQGVSLYQFCCQNSYNYNVIYYNMKKNGLTPEESIDQYLKCGQATRFRYKYALGDVLLYHFLIKMNLEDRYVMDRIRKGRSEEDAIIDAIFLNRETYKTRTIRNRLRAIYSQCNSVDELTKLKAIYHLDDEDLEFINKKAYRVEEVLSKHRMFYILSLIQATGITDEIRNILVEFNVDTDELVEIQRELLDGFAEITDISHKGQIKYVWHKEY